MYTYLRIYTLYADYRFMHCMYILYIYIIMCVHVCVMCIHVRRCVCMCNRDFVIENNIVMYFCICLYFKVDIHVYTTNLNVRINIIEWSNRPYSQHCF